MNHFDVRPNAAGADELYCEDVPLSRIAEAVGTPVYVYSTATIERHYTVFRAAFGDRDVMVAYAVKANSNCAPWRPSARGPTRSRRVRSVGPWRRGCPPNASSSPASARPATS
jgi:hypothetical protein